MKSPLLIKVLYEQHLIVTFHAIVTLKPIEDPLKFISTQEKFPRIEHFPKISLLKVENFQLFSNFFLTENICRPITFYKKFFLRMGLYWTSKEISSKTDRAVSIILYKLFILRYEDKFSTW